MHYTWLLSEREVGCLTFFQVLCLCICASVPDLSTWPHGQVVVGAIESWKVPPHPSVSQCVTVCHSVSQCVTVSIQCPFLLSIHFCRWLRLQAKFGKCPCSGAREASACTVKPRDWGWWLKHHGPRSALQVGLGEKSECKSTQWHPTSDRLDFHCQDVQNFVVPYISWSSFDKRSLEYQASDVPPLSELAAWVFWKISAHLTMHQHFQTPHTQHGMVKAKLIWLLVRQNMKKHLWFLTHSYTTSLISFRSIYSCFFQISLRFPWNRWVHILTSTWSRDISAESQVALETTSLHGDPQVRHDACRQATWFSAKKTQMVNFWGNLLKGLSYNFEKKKKKLDTSAIISFWSDASHFSCHHDASCLMIAAMPEI